MKAAAGLIIILYISAAAKGQSITTDTVAAGKVVIIKDNRLDVLAKKEASFNDALNTGPRVGKGYRLVVLTTSDRVLAMKVRSQLLQRYPDQKAYTIFQSPNIKIKFGNFLDKGEADNVRKDILKSKIVTGNIYVMPENIEVKPEKKEEKTDKK